MRQAKIDACLSIVLAAFVLSALPFQTSAFGQTEQRPSWTRTATGRGGQASVEIHAALLDPHERLLSLWKTDTGYTPRTAVDRFSIEVDHQRVSPRLDFELILFDPHDVRLSADHEDFVLEVVGGDGAEAYRARLWFNRTRVLRSELQGEGDSVSQTTHYNTVTTE